MKLNRLVPAIAAAVIVLTGCNRTSTHDEVPTTNAVPDRSQRTDGQESDDRDITSKVRDALRDNAEYKFEDVKVTTFKGTVQLSGFVATADQKRTAGDIAAKVAGVKDVQNNITLK